MTFLRRDRIVTFLPPLYLTKWSGILRTVVTRSLPFKTMILLITLPTIPNSLLIVNAAPPALDDPTAAAFETIFNPDRSPPNRTMGLVQRNFLDLVEGAKPKLQVAFVVDGTSSMTESLASVKSTLARMMDDLELYKSADVAYQLVVYRDIGSKSGKVSFPLKVAGKKFSSDRDSFQRAFESVEPEAGAPYFHELIDVGIHEAIQTLEWSDDKDTSKWIIVIGDAPPFDKGFHEADTQARRHFDDGRLAALATASGIRVSFILVASRPAERELYEQVLDSTRTFMSSIASETDGLMLDLSYPDIQKVLLSAAKKPRKNRTAIGAIEQEDVELLRTKANESKTAMADSQRVKLAVLPHLELNKMSFRADVPEVQLATDLRRRFREIPGVDVKSSRVVREYFQRLSDRGLDEQQLLQMLASSMGVDFLVWGDMSRKQGVVELTSAIYRKSDGVKVGAGRGSKENVTDATRLLVADVVNRTVTQRSDLRLVNVLGSIGNDQIARNQILTPVSSVKAAVNPILAAYEELEQAMSLGADSSEAFPILKSARARLDEVVEIDPTNPLSLQLLANCCFSQAQIAELNGDVELAGREFAQARAALQRAKGTRNHPVLTDNLKTEISADYALLVQRKFEEAVAQYERLTEAQSDSKEKIYLDTALRAHWMLAGIRCGDWGAADQAVVDVEKGKQHLTAILAYWPESPEASYIRTKLRWDNQAAATAFEHFPQQGPGFLRARANN